MRIIKYIIPEFIILISIILLTIFINAKIAPYSALLGIFLGLSVAFTMDSGIKKYRIVAFFVNMFLSGMILSLTIILLG